MLSTFPSAPAVERLQAFGVEYVVVHASRYPQREEMRRRMVLVGDLAGASVVAEVGIDRVYRVHPRTAGLGRAPISTRSAGEFPDERASSQ